MATSLSGSHHVCNIDVKAVLQAILPFDEEDAMRGRYIPSGFELRGIFDDTPQQRPAGGRRQTARKSDGPAMAMHH